MENPISVHVVDVFVLGSLPAVKKRVHKVPFTLLTCTSPVWVYNLFHNGLLKALCHDIRRNCIVMTSLVQKSNQSGYRK